MPDKIDKIPENTRWEIATKGLTGAFIAISNAMKQAVGQKKFEEFNGPLWHEAAAKDGKQFAQSFGLPTETAEDVSQVADLLAKSTMGPEFQFEVVEASKDKCVTRTTECPWQKRWKEQGLDFDPCGVGHQSWGSGLVEALNPNYTFKLLKVMPRGDSYCEWVIERKK